MKKEQTIPCFIIEEHHEAFIVWTYAIQQGWIQPTGNCLFHVDEHSDMGTPRFNESIHNLNGSVDKVKEFTYNELNIASFIIPACYREILNQVYWIRQKHRKTLHQPVEMYVRSYNQSGKKLISGKTKDIKTNIDDPDKKKFDYYLRTLEQLPSNKSVILDIDLDFFSCSGNPNELDEIYIEISKEEYDNFVNNKYHRLRYCSLGKFETKEKNEKYFYVINNYNEIYPTDAKVDEISISERIDYFIKILKRKNVNPLMIDICRSRFSGYTPNDQWMKIEEVLMDNLQKLYTVKLYDIEL